MKCLWLMESMLEAFVLNILLGMHFLWNLRNFLENYWGNWKLWTFWMWFSSVAALKTCSYFLKYFRTPISVTCSPNNTQNSLELDTNYFRHNFNQTDRYSPPKLPHDSTRPHKRIFVLSITTKAVEKTIIFHFIVIIISFYGIFIF